MDKMYLCFLTCNVTSLVCPRSKFQQRPYYKQLFAILKSTKFDWTSQLGGFPVKWNIVILKSRTKYSMPEIKLLTFVIGSAVLTITFQREGRNIEPGSLRFKSSL